ncbi:MAG: hypothetical protein H0X39_06250 [Actinobacteria bacterium]|nr:hypothetical protein [Actinomycetota bacterium]
MICYVETGAVMTSNALIVAIGALEAVLLVALPAMPAFPTLPSGLSFIGWLIPFTSLAGVLSSVVTLLLSVYALQVALRWVKAL